MGVSGRGNGAGCVRVSYPAVATEDLFGPGSEGFGSEGCSSSAFCSSSTGCPCSTNCSDSEGCPGATKHSNAEGCPNAQGYLDPKDYPGCEGCSDSKDHSGCEGFYADDTRYYADNKHRQRSFHVRRKHAASAHLHDGWFLGR